MIAKYRFFSIQLFLTFIFFFLLLLLLQGGQSAQTYVHIEIEDLNDNAPVFNPEQYTMSVSSHAPPGTEILSVIATDQDSGRFGHISYSIIPGDVSSLFILDTQTGKDTEQYADLCLSAN